MLLNALAIVCGLSAVVFATCATRVPAMLAMAAGFIAATIAISPVRFPEPSWVAVAVALAAGAALWKPHWSVVAAGAGGLAASVWAELLAAQGLPAYAVFPAVVAFAGGSAFLAATRPSYAPARLKEEALMIVAAFALIVAAAPSVIEGFDAAVALTAVRLSGDASPTAPWALVLAAACLAIGAVYSIWKHR